MKISSALSLSFLSPKLVMLKSLLRSTLPLFALAILWSTTFAQDAREALGPKDNAAQSKEPHALTQLMAAKTSALRKELRGVHPRVYVTEAGLQTLRERARTTHRELWQRALDQIRAVRKEPAPAPAQERRAQNEVGIGIAEAALAYKITGEKKYLEAAKRYLEAAVSYDVWGYTYSKPNIDLAAGHLLFGMGWGYDLLYHDLTETERGRYRDKLAKHARLLFDYYQPKPGRSYSYSQNHVFIPMAGLGVAAYALYDEVQDAPQWAALARAIYERVLATYSPDGYYYEGFEYWVFSAPWIIHYLDAQAHATGEDLYDHPGLKQMHLYVAHSTLPGGKYIFDFGDVYEGAITRAGKGDEYKRANPGGRFHTNYNILYRLAGRFQSADAQGVAAWMKELDHYNAEEYWSLFWYDATLKPKPITEQTPHHYFPDHEIVFWRSDWSTNATAFAFKCGPPEGHHTTAKLKAFPDWHLSAGHAHPDANSFIIFANGQYLTGDTGYAGVPMTAHHNTLLVDGKGQAKEGKGHDAFSGVSYDRMNGIRIAEVKLGRDYAYVRGEAAAAYEPELGLTKFTRSFLFTAPNGFVIQDDVAAHQPRTFTRLIHADNNIEIIEQNQYAIKTENAKLRLTSLTPDEVSARVEPNILTAPGRPGSVDKGEQQKRGQRLALQNNKPASEIRFVILLHLDPAK
jgi:hypothetical protein